MACIHRCPRELCWAEIEWPHSLQITEFCSMIQSKAFCFGMSLSKRLRQDESVRKGHYGPSSGPDFPDVGPISPIGQLQLVWVGEPASRAEPVLVPQISCSLEIFQILACWIGCFFNYSQKKGSPSYSCLLRSVFPFPTLNVSVVQLKFKTPSRNLERGSNVLYRFYRIEQSLENKMSFSNPVLKR